MCCCSMPSKKKKNFTQCVSAVILGLEGCGKTTLVKQFRCVIAGGKWCKCRKGCRDRSLPPLTRGGGSFKKGSQKGSFGDGSE